MTRPRSRWPRATSLRVDATAEQISAAIAGDELEELLTNRIDCLAWEDLLVAEGQIQQEIATRADRALHAMVERAAREEEST